MLSEGVTFIKTWQFSQFTRLRNILEQKYERKHEAQKKSKVKDKFAGIITRYERH